MDTASEARLQAQLKRDEGIRLHPYQDSVGKITIGVGRNLKDVGISLAEAEYLLANDIARATLDVAMHLPWSERLSDAHLAVLINMAFNMGINSLLGFTNTLAKVQAGDYFGAAQGMLSSKWATQVGARATRLAKQMETGEWQ